MIRYTWLALLGAALATTAAAQVPTAPSEEQLKAMAAAQAAYNAMPDTPGTGAFPAIKEMARSLPGHTIYRPANLAAVEERSLGLVAWGNGGCSPDGASSRLHLEEIASHGYVVIAPGKIMSGPGMPPPPPPAPGAPQLIAQTTAAQVLAGIDWALAENEREGSPLYHLIDPAKVAVSGYSCGGVQALDLARDPRIKAVVIHNSGLFPDGARPIAGIVTDKAWLDRLHTPVVYIMGGPTDIAYENGLDDFGRISKVPVAWLNENTGHGGTFQEPNGGAAAKVAVAWLEWQLRGDEKAKAMFVGEHCGLCSSTTWTIERKNFETISR